MVGSRGTLNTPKGAPPPTAATLRSKQLCAAKCSKLSATNLEVLHFAKGKVGCPHRQGCRATSNTLTYLIILGVTLSLIAYSLSTFLQFQTQIKNPVQQSLNATARSSSEFAAALSDDFGFVPASAGSNATTADPAAALIAIETLPPYFQNTPALFQITITNPSSALMRIEKLLLEVKQGNATIVPEPHEFENLDVAYKKTKDSQFTPQSPGNYTLRAIILKNSTVIRTAEKAIMVQPPPGQKQTTSFSGIADFSLNTTARELFYYELKNRHFSAAGAGKTWRITLPHNFSYSEFTFLNFTKNANTGIGSQFIPLAGTYFNTSTDGGYDSLLTSESAAIYPNATADYLAVLAASACPATIFLHYENTTETRNLSLGTDICPLGQQCTNSRQIGAILHRQTCGEDSKKYLHASKIPLRNERLLKIEMLPQCQLYLSALTLGTEKTHTYNQPSSAYLILQNTSLAYVNNRQYPRELFENFNAQFQKIDLTDRVLSGEREFNISTDAALSFTPYLTYAEILNQATSNPNISGAIQSLKLILEPELSFQKEEFSKQYSYGSSAGSCYSETGMWSFGTALPETPEVSIGTLGIRVTATADWPSDAPPTVTTTLVLPGYGVSQSSGQIDVSSGKAMLSLGGYNTPQDGTPAIYNSISHGDSNVRLDYTSSANLKLFFGSVEAEDHYYALSGITEKTQTITLPDDLIGLYLVIKSELPSVKYPLAAAGFWAKAEIFGETHSTRGYLVRYNGWDPVGYARMMITDEAVFADLTQKALPGQQVSLRLMTETDTSNSLESDSATFHLLALKKRPFRIRLSSGNQTLSANITKRTELQIQSANTSARIDGTGKVRGVLEASTIKDTKTKILAPSFSKALLLLEPDGRITSLQIIVNNQLAKNYPEISNIDKTDLSQYFVPGMQNTIEFKGEGGALNWKIIFE